MLSLEVKNLISQMLILNPKERISIPEILSHPWMMNHDQLLGDDMEDFSSFNNKDLMSGLSS
jgi:serine/threonine protein kinase